MLAFLFIPIALILVFTFCLLLPLLAIIDIIRSRFNGNDNVLFLLMVLFVPFGSIIYFVVAPSRKVYNA